MDSENSKKSTLPAQLSTVVFYLAILFFIIGFSFTDTPPGPFWYQQFMPNLNNRPLVDITFTDSLTGYAITTNGFSIDTNYILRTSNSGNNWSILSSVYASLTRLQFINSTTGFICGGTAAGDYLIRSTNGGLNWVPVNVPASARIYDMFVLNTDTIWIIDDEFNYNVYRTTNGGSSWLLQLGFSSSNPKIYMYNQNIGFVGDNFSLRKTTDGGFNWTQIPGEKGFIDMYFVDSLKGWKSDYYINNNDSNMRKTTDGGLSWQTQYTPKGPNLSYSIGSFSNTNSDTIWGTGGVIQFPNLRNRGILYRTTNGGDNWLFQIPDTNINIYSYGKIKFYNKLIGWAYATSNGIHTIIGGDTGFYAGIQKISNEIPGDFTLKQNYPNPFNPRTVIGYNLKKAAYIKITAYDILGKEAQKLVDQKQSAGEYQVDFMGKFAASGVYFYRMEVTDEKSGLVFTDTKKMLLIK